VNCLVQALQAYGAPEIFNTDHGCQFTSEAFTGMLKAPGIAISMDGPDGHWITSLWNGAWVANIACTKPRDHGLAAELWTISGLARFVSEHAKSEGFPRLAHAGKEHYMAHPRRERNQAPQNSLLPGKTGSGL